MIIAPPPLTEVTAGNTVFFSCAGYGIPTPYITWSRNGTQLYNNTRVRIYTRVVNEGGVQLIHSLLELCSVIPADEGDYACEMENVVGTNSSTFYLEVLGEPGLDILRALINVDQL